MWSITLFLNRLFTFKTKVYCDYPFSFYFLYVGGLVMNSDVTIFTIIEQVRSKELRKRRIKGRNNLIAVAPNSLRKNKSSGFVLSVS